MALLRLGHKRQYGSHRLSVDDIAGGINIEVSEHAERAGARSSSTVRADYKVSQALVETFARAENVREL